MLSDLEQLGVVVFGFGFTVMFCDFISMSLLNFKSHLAKLKTATRKRTGVL